MEVGSWEGIISKVIDVTRHRGRETKVTSQGKQRAQYDRFEQNVRKMCKCTTWQRTLRVKLENQCLFRR